MVIKQGHQPFVIYQPTLTQIRDDTPALLLNRPPTPAPTFGELLVHHMGNRYWQVAETGYYIEVRNFDGNGYYI